MTRLALATAALALAACADAPVATYDPAMRLPDEPVAFVHGEGGWRLSTVPPRFPYGAETTPRFDGLSGAGTPGAFGCGLEPVRRGYFSTVRGRLICAMGQADGGLRLRAVSSADYTRVYDAAVVSGRTTVVAHPYGQTRVVVMTVTPAGGAAVIGRLPEQMRPDQAALLPSGRIAVLHRDGDACVWSVFTIEDGNPRETARAGADHRYQCQSSSSSTRLIRDQVSGEAYIRMRHPAPNMLYRIGDNGAAGPATRVSDDFTGGRTGDPQIETAIRSSVYFSLPNVAGPVAGRYDIASGQTRTMDMTSPTGRWQDAPRLTGFMIGEASGDPPRMTLMDLRSGETTLATVRVGD